MVNYYYGSHIERAPETGPNTRQDNWCWVNTRRGRALTLTGRHTIDRVFTLSAFQSERTGAQLVVCLMSRLNIYVYLWAQAVEYTLEFWYLVKQNGRVLVVQLMLVGDQVLYCGCQPEVE